MVCRRVGAPALAGDGGDRDQRAGAAEVTVLRRQRECAALDAMCTSGTQNSPRRAQDHFAITAQQIGKLSIAGEKIALNKNDKDDILLDENNGDFRVVEV